MARTIQSPGVEIKEVDLSLRPNIPVGTTVFIPGFANQGPTDELLTVSSLSEFEQIYGLPQNAAERYMYHSVKAVFQSPANILVSRLPYGQGAGSTVADKYSVQVYPVIPRPIIVDGAAPEINTIEKDERIIAWHPKDPDAVDAGGDYVLAQSASSNYAGTVDVVTIDKGADKNNWTIVVDVSATDNTNTFDALSGVFQINSTALRLTGKDIANRINSSFADKLSADGGLIDTPAVVASLSADDVHVTATAPGSAGNVVVARDTGTFSTVTDQGVTIEADVASPAGDVTLVANPGTQATVSDQGAVVTANNVGVAGNVTITPQPATTAGVTDQGIELVADVAGAAGNATITVTGSDTIDDIIALFNIANPTNTITVVSGGTIVPQNDLTLVNGVDALTITELVNAHNTANVGNELTVVSGGTVVPTIDLVLAGGSDQETAQDLVIAHNIANVGNELTVVSGGTVVPTIDLVLAGGIAPKTVQQLVDDWNSLNPTLTLNVVSGGSSTPVSDLILTGGAELIHSSDSLYSDVQLNFAGGVDAGLSTKVVPLNEWRFGETDPGGYVGTTLKDAVDSVIAGIPALSGYSQNDLYWAEETAGDPLSIPALKAYETPEIADLVAQAVNSVGWDLSASDRYYLGEPSNIELDNQNFQKTIKGEVKLSEQNAGKLENQKFNSYEDLLTKGGAGLIIVNDKKFVVNEKFEGYYLGISDNTNLNPATDFDAVGKLKSLSKKLGGTTGGYVNVPDADAGTKSRLTFSLSAGFLFDQYGNKQQVGLDGSMSEVLENLSEFDLNTDEFSDVLSIAVFKVRQSTLEPDATKLDYLVADSVIGSVNYFRERFLSTGGTSTSYFIESEAENSNNLYMKFNEGISKTAGNWLDENGYPTRKIRVLPAKDVRYYDELSTIEKSNVDQEVNDFKVSQAFLNGSEEREDRAYIKSWQDLQRSGTAKVKHANNVYPHGVYRKQAAAAKESGNIPAKLDRIFELADNFDLFPIDITIEAGLGTVYVGTDGGTIESFDDEEYFNIGEHVVSSTGLSGSGLYTTKLIDNRSEINYLVNYDVIFDTFKSFSQFQRKDNIFIADPLRYIFVQGRNSKTLTSKQREAGVNFSQHIYWPLRHMMTGGTKNSSYCCSYANWGFTNDKALNRGVWVPMSGFAAAAMGNTDSNFYPWIAPAGFTRGLVSGIQDLAFYPKQKERDQLYKIGLNPVANFPNEGFAIFGQKTMQAKPSAFDRINVRRLFLYLQKATMNTVKYFVFEPNTLFTRTQVINVLRPIFEEVKNTQGMYDYLIVCDERNNPADTIDRNELVVDIYIKPTRAAEFILVNFYATRTGQDFSELVS